MCYDRAPCNRIYRAAFSQLTQTRLGQLPRTSFAQPSMHHACMHYICLAWPNTCIIKQIRSDFVHYSWCLKSASHLRTGTLIRCNQLASLRCSSRMSMWWSVLPRELGRQESWSSLYYALCRGEIVSCPTPRNRRNILRILKNYF